MKTLKKSLLIIALLIGAIAFSQLRLPKLVSNGMVLQRDANIKIWGWASPGELVTINFMNGRGQATASNTGNWELQLPKFPAGGPYTMTISGSISSDIITISDILIGDVWLCSGQSNMQLTVAGTGSTYQTDIANSTNDYIRHFKVPLDYEFTTPNTDLSGGAWMKANPTNVLQFSAVAYFFAKALYQKYNIPIGLINASRGSTPIQAWMSETAIVKDFPELQAEIDFLQIPANVAQIEQDNLTDPTPVDLWVKPTGLFNGMIFPLKKYAVKGTIWYQGEANTSKPTDYAKLLPSLIGNWRYQFNNLTMPFLYVQLPNFGAEQALASGNESSKWALLRESQLKSLSVPYTGMVTTIDIGNPTNIHPLTKKPVGDRLALKARSVVFGENLISSGPMYESVRVVGKNIELTYPTWAILKFISTGTATTHQNFAVAGADKVFYWANATISGNKITIWNDAIPNPVALRYAWADNPNGTKLFNNSNLPASPFQLDFTAPSTSRIATAKNNTAAIRTNAISLNDDTVILYPNPSSGVFNLKSASNISKINIYGPTGSFIKTVKLKDQTKEVRVNEDELPKGIYFIELQNDADTIWKKVLID